MQRIARALGIMNILTDGLIPLLPVIAAMTITIQVIRRNNSLEVKHKHAQQ